jgi:hypothetical protein
VSKSIICRESAWARACERVAAEQQRRVYDPDDGSHVANVLDVSHGGLRLVVRMEVPRGVRMHIEVALDPSEDSERVTFEVEARWALSAAVLGYYEVGVAFVGDYEEASARLVEAVSGGSSAV